MRGRIYTRTLMKLGFLRDPLLKLLEKIRYKFSIEELAQALIISSPRAFLESYLLVVFLGMCLFIPAIFFSAYFAYQVVIGNSYLLPQLGASILVTVIGIILFLYPKLLVMNRRARVVEKLKREYPKVVIYMYTMALSQVPLNVMIEDLSNKKDIPETSKVFNMLKRNMMVFGQDLSTALNNIEKFVPYKPLIELIKGCIAFEAVDQLNSYLKDRYIEEKSKIREQLESLLKSVEMINPFIGGFFIIFPSFIAVFLLLLGFSSSRAFAGMVAALQIVLMALFIMAIVMGVTLSKFLEDRASIY